MMVHCPVTHCCLPQHCSLARCSAVCLCCWTDFFDQLVFLPWRDSLAPVVVVVVVVVVVASDRVVAQATMASPFLFEIPEMRTETPALAPHRVFVTSLGQSVVLVIPDEPLADRSTDRFRCSLLLLEGPRFPRPRIEKKIGGDDSRTHWAAQSPDPPRPPHGTASHSPP